MSKAYNNVKEFVTQPPLFFPIGLLFHIIGLFFTMFTMIGIMGKATIIGFLWMVAYTISWGGATALKKWGGIGYILVTCASIIVYFLLHSEFDRQTYKSGLFLIDIAFSLYIFLNFRKLK